MFIIEYESEVFLAMALAAIVQKATPNPVYKYTSEVNRAKPADFALSIDCIYCPPSCVNHYNNFLI